MNFPKTEQVNKEQYNYLNGDERNTKRFNKNVIW